MSSRDDRHELDAAALDRLWDAMNRKIMPISGRTGSASTDAADVIRVLVSRDDAPALHLPLQDDIWASVAASTLEGPPHRVSGAATHVGNENRIGRHLRMLFALLQRAVRLSAIGAIAGMLVGTVVIGGGSRLFMYIAMLLSDAEQRGTITANENVAGQITFDGTMAVLVFVGTFFGLIAGIAVMAVRPWLPANGPWRYLATGAIGFAVAAPVVLEGGENVDYKRFGILGLNICLFTALPFLFGIAVMPVIDWLDRRISTDLPGVSRGWWDVPKSCVMVMLFVPSIQLVVQALALAPVGLLLMLPVIRVLWPFWAHHARTIETRRRREVIGMRIGRVALLVPCLLGLVMLVQAIERLRM